MELKDTLKKQIVGDQLIKILGKDIFNYILLPYLDKACAGCGEGLQIKERVHYKLSQFRPHIFCMGCKNDYCIYCIKRMSVQYKHGGFMCLSCCNIKKVYKKNI